MLLDVRIPIGWLFLVLGAMLAIYGYSTPQGTAAFNTATGTLPLNINIPWGILMFLFGLGTVSVAKLDSAKQAAQETTAASTAATSPIESATEAAAETTLELPENK